MATLVYVGPDASAATHIQDRLQITARLGTGTSRSYVDGQAATIAATKASKTYIDAQDATFALATYYPTRDALLVPLSSKGVAGGVATLDSGTGKVPDAQVPILGTGMVKGPWGVVNTFTVSTSGTPTKLADWGTLPGITALNFKPLVFVSAFVQSDKGGRPVIEVRIGSPTQTAYVDQTLVATGYGRTLWGDYQAVVCQPSPQTTSEMQDGVQHSFSPSTDWRLTAWLYDANNMPVVSNGGLMAAASCWLAVVSP